VCRQAYSDVNRIAHGSHVGRAKRPQRQAENRDAVLLKGDSFIADSGTILSRSSSPGDLAIYLYNYST
jgi:hypothetical protein